MKLLKKQVESVLKENETARNSDVTLTIAVWRKFYNIDNVIWVKQLYDLPREDNIKRIRAKFCEEGNRWAFPTSLEVARQRKINETKWREILGYSSVSNCTGTGLLF